MTNAKRVMARLEVASEMQIIKDCAKAIRQNSTLTPIEKKSEVGGGECFIEIDSNRGGNVTEKDLARMKKALSKYNVKEVLVQLNGGSSNDQIVFSSDEWSRL